MKTLSGLIAVLALCCSAAVTHADPLSLDGSRVRGTFVYLGDPSQTNQFSPARATVGAGKEFSYDDSFATFSANFTDFGLVFRVSCDTGIGLNKCVSNEGPFIVLFRDKLFSSATINVLADSLGALYVPSSVLPDDRYIGIAILNPWTQRDSTIVLSIVPAPEPAGFALLATGMLGIAGAVRRRFRA